MGLDKGKARKSLSADKSTDRAANVVMHYTDNVNEGVARGLEIKSGKRNISQKTRQAMISAAAMSRANIGPPSLKGK